MQIDRYCSVNVSPENMYLEWLVVTPERQQTLEVLSPSVGHACIRLQIGLKAHASSRRRISQQQTEEADRDTRCVSVWHLVRVRGISCSIFLESTAKNIHRRSDDLRNTHKTTARRWKEMTGVSSWHGPRAHPARSSNALSFVTPGGLVNLLVGQVLSVASNFLEETQNQFIFSNRQIFIPQSSSRSRRIIC